MARGIDIPDVDWVVQFDPPSATKFAFITDSFQFSLSLSLSLGHSFIGVVGRLEWGGVDMLLCICFLQSQHMCIIWK